MTGEGAVDDLAYAPHPMDDHPFDHVVSSCSDAEILVGGGEVALARSAVLDRHPDLARLRARLSFP